MRRPFRATIAGIIGSGLAFAVPWLAVGCAGACGAACAAPFVTLLGLSAAGMFASEHLRDLQLFLLALSAASYGFAFHSLYGAASRAGDCPTHSHSSHPPESGARRHRLARIFFWISVLMGVGFLAYPALFRSSPRQSADSPTENPPRTAPSCATRDAADGCDTPCP